MLNDEIIKTLRKIQQKERVHVLELNSMRIHPPIQGVTPNPHLIHIFFIILFYYLKENQLFLRYLENNLPMGLHKMLYILFLKQSLIILFYFYIYKYI